jgi:hypothetical protein
MTQVVEDLLGKLEALTSIPSTTKKQNKTKQNPIPKLSLSRQKLTLALETLSSIILTDLTLSLLSPYYNQLDYSTGV